VTTTTHETLNFQPWKLMTTYVTCIRYTSANM